MVSQRLDQGTEISSIGSRWIPEVLRCYNWREHLIFDLQIMVQGKKHEVLISKLIKNVYLRILPFSALLFLGFLSYVRVISKKIVEKMKIKDKFILVQENFLIRTLTTIHMSNKICEISSCSESCYCVHFCLSTDKLS